jgi:hypothetical protein
MSAAAADGMHSKSCCRPFLAFFLLPSRFRLSRQWAGQPASSQQQRPINPFLPLSNANKFALLACCVLYLLAAVIGAAGSSSCHRRRRAKERGERDGAHCTPIHQPHSFVRVCVSLPPSSIGLLLPLLRPSWYAVWSSSHSTSLRPSFLSFITLISGPSVQQESANCRQRKLSKQKQKIGRSKHVKPIN